MPELPEVETIRRGLLPKIKGQRIDGITEDGSKVFQTDPELLGRHLPGQAIRDLHRRAKYLIFDLERHRVIVHLGMTGQLTLRSPEKRDSDGFLRHPVTGLQRTRQHAPDRHTHFQIHLANGTSVLFRDVRKFGKVYLYDNADERAVALLARLGPEPFSENYTLKGFLEKAGVRKLRIKSLLLDQRFIAGVGNIYADEALFQAGVFPGRRVCYLRKYEKVRIYEAVPDVLRKGIVAGGTTISDYVDSDGEVGGFQEQLNVYGREGQRCYRCDSVIQKTVVGQRGTHYCPVCQKR